MSLPHKSNLIPRARSLRKNMTPQERKLWYDCLRYCKPRFHRQAAIGNYIADFYCHKAKLVVEVDGRQHDSPEGQIYDSIRTERMEEFGLTVVRIPNGTIDRDFSYVTGYLAQTLNLSLDKNPEN